MIFLTLYKATCMGIFADDTKLYRITQSVYQRTPQFYRMTLTQFCNSVPHSYPFLTFLNAIIAPSVILPPTLSIFSPLNMMGC